MKSYWQNTTAKTRLLVCALGSGLIYLAFSASFQLRRFYAVSPPVDYAKLTNHSPFGLVAYLFGILGLFGLYLLALRILANSRNQMPEMSKLRFVLLAGVFFALILMFSYPQTAIDLLVYAIRTRGWVLYGLSPFTVSPNTFPSTDPWLSLAGEWADATSPYGPIWEWISLSAYHMGGGDYLYHLYALKIISILAYLGNAWLVYRILCRVRPKWAVLGVAFFAWNPLVLFESVQNAHNDIIMIFFFMIAVWAYVHWVEQPKFLFGLVFIFAFALSILIKFVTILVLPIFLLGLALRQPDWSKRIIIPMLFGLAIMLISILVMAPYWPGLDNWAVLEAGKGAGRSVTALLVLSLIPIVGSTSGAFDIANGLIYLVFGGIYLWGIWRVACQGKKCFQGATNSIEMARELPIRVSFYLFFWYALFVASVFHAWYLLWFMPLAGIMVSDRRIISGAFVFSLMALLIIPYFETVRVWLPYLNQIHLLGHAIGVPLLVVPVLFSLLKPFGVLPGNR